jgi:hypothetical protein
MSVHASTLVIVFALAVGVGVTEAFDEGLDDPQALMARPHATTTAIKPLAEMGLARAPTRLMLAQ